MLPFAGYIAVLLLTLSECKATQIERHDVRKFPEGFLFGTSTAAYQIEGGWDADGKSENIWDYLTHTDPCSIDDCSNGDVAGDSYHKYKRDVEMMRELGVDFYRFSLSWSRILPTSFPDKINEAGAQYYSNLIDELLKYNIEPMVTLYHWDLPQRLQDLGGWANPDIADWFADYARVVYGLYGDRVKYWITINEPREICYQGYGADTKAPRVNIKGVGEYLCAKNLIMAHAKGYHVYDQEFRPKYNGSIFIALSAELFEPETESDIEAAEEGNQFEWGIYSHPIFSDTGDFPPIVKEKVAAKSAEQGFFRSRLPEFTPEEIELVKGSSDFFGLNHYSTNLVYRNESVVGLYEIPSFYDDLGNVHYQPDHWEKSASGFLKVVPWGFHKILTKIKEDYNNPVVYITENGFSNRGGIDDDDRISFHRRYLNAMLDAIDEGCDVRAYSIWSLMDNFEWMRGYTERFGLYEVDYESDERTRTPRKSAFVYKQMLRTRALDFDYEPDTTVMTIDEGHYNESVVGKYDVPSFYDDLGNVHYQPNDWEHGVSSFLKVILLGFYKLLTQIRQDYNNTAVIITENGYSTYGGLDDDERISYVRKYLSAVLDVIDEGSDIRAYTVWSLMDNFEWMRGYTERFGLYEVDYESDERTRTPRKSAFVYKQILRTRALDWDYEPDSSVMTIDEGH